MDIATMRTDAESLRRHLSTAFVQLESADKAAGQDIERSYRASARKEFDECQALLDKIKEAAGLD